MPLEPTGFARAHVELAVVAEVPTGIIVLPDAVPAVIWIQSKAPVSEHSPPDLTVLHSAFLI